MSKSESRDFAQRVVDWALSKKAEDLALLDLRGLFDVTDCFVVATGGSEIQCKAIANAVLEGALEEGQKPLHVEGLDSANWILLDFVDVVVHIMMPEPRRHYALERLWGDAPMLRYDETGQPIGSSGEESQA